MINSTIEVASEGLDATRGRRYVVDYAAKGAFQLCCENPLKKSADEVLFRKSYLPYDKYGWAKATMGLWTFAPHSAKDAKSNVSTASSSSLESD